MSGQVLKLDGTWGQPAAVATCPPHVWGYRSIGASPHRYGKPEPAVRCSNCGVPRP